ncbi:MAG: SDR family NAD(P)-dependent oxidoreductase [Rhodospirillales bacterium]
MDLNLSGKVAWVAGGTGALGASIALALAREGARPVITSRRAEAAAEVAARIRQETNAAALAVAADVTQPDQAKAAAARIVREAGRIDILVNTMTVPAFGPFAELEAATWRAAIDTKYLGYINTMQAALPHMVAQGDGRIVNVTGTGGKQPIAIHMPGGSVNAAVNLLTKGLATDYATRGVRVNAVSPGPIASPRQDQMIAAGMGGAEGPAKAIPMRRLGRAEEVADAVLFLASDRASYITGTILQVDGGGVLAVS